MRGRTVRLNNHRRSSEHRGLHRQRDAVRRLLTVAGWHGRRRHLRVRLHPGLGFGGAALTALAAGDPWQDADGETDPTLGEPEVTGRETYTGVIDG